VDDYFTIEKIQDLIENHNWVLARQGDVYFLHQRDKDYMKTRWFTLSHKDAALIKEKAPKGRG